MSLVNQMLRDLHERRATDNEPLTGLHAVSVGSATEPARGKHGWILVVAVASVVIVVATWWRSPDGVGNKLPELANESVATMAPAPLQPQHDVGQAPDRVTLAEKPKLTSLEVNRLDYSLSLLPRPRGPKPVPARQASTAAIEADTVDEPKRSEQPTEAPGVEVKQAVATAVRLRRDGVAALRAERVVVAGDLFRQLVDADPGDSEAYLLLHTALRAQSRDSEAHSALLQGLGRVAEPARLAKVLAHEMLAEGRVDDALAILMRHQPNAAVDLDYEALLAAVNQRAGHHAAAATLYESLVARQPANGDWWVGLAISQEAQGLVAQAAESFATASAAGTLDFRLARYAAERLERLEQGS